MEKNKNIKFNVKIITNRFIPTVILILILGIAINTILHYELNKSFELANIISISGKQSMLTQKISKDAYALFLTSSEKEAKLYLNDLKESVIIWGKVNNNLKSGITANIKNVENRNNLNELFDKISVNEKEMLNAYKNIINMFETKNISSVEFTKFINLIHNNESIYLEVMENIVSQYEEEINNKILFAKNIAESLFYLSCLALVFIIFFVFFSAKKSLDKTYEDIKESKEEAESFRNIAIKDFLTGLFNRYYFDLRVHDEMVISERYDEPLTMMMLDLDHFKNVNDTWGHLAGDQVLKKTAEVLGSTIRKSDFVFRVGGEEFVVLMPKTNIEDAICVAEKIRKAIENTKYDISEIVTISIGVSIRQKSETLENWYGRTDKALYYAKESGRNCVVNYEEMNNNIIALAHIDWKNQWNSGNSEIDNQHKKLVEIANTLIFMSFSKNSSEKILEQLNLVINHIVNHFKYEEKILAKIGYHNYDEHVELHKKLLEKSLILKEAYSKGELKSTALFSYVVEDVVVGHMIEEDTKFISSIKKATSSN